MLNYLNRVGVVPPSSRRHGPRGHGIPRRYTFADLVSFKVVRKLTESGVSPVKVRHAIRELHALGISPASLPTTRVVIFEKSVYKWSGRSDPFRLADGQQAFGFILDLGLIRSELNVAINTLAEAA